MPFLPSLAIELRIGLSVYVLILEWWQWMVAHRINPLRTVVATNASSPVPQSR